MTTRTPAVLKRKFETGVTPAYQDFVDLIDSQLHVFLDNFPALPPVSGKNLRDIGGALPDPLPARGGEKLTNISPAEFALVSGMPVPTHVTSTSIQLAGDWTSEFPNGRRLRLTIAGTAFYTESTGASFGGGNTTVDLLDAMPGSGITACLLAVIRPTAGGGGVSLSTLGMSAYVKTLAGSADAQGAQAILLAREYVDQQFTLLHARNWTERVAPKAIHSNGICFGNGQFVIVGNYDGVDCYILTSTDGINWTEQSNAKANVNLHDVWFANGLYVAVGQSDGVDGTILTSTDGITWTERSTPKATHLNSVIFGNNLWVAAGGADGTDAYIVTSPDGITWTERANPLNGNLQDVTFGGGQFVAVGNNIGGQAYIVTSPDGITWTQRSNPKNFSLFCVTYGNGLYVAAGFNDGSDAYLLTSPDGITWTERANPRTHSLLGATFAHGVFVLVGAVSGQPDAYLLISQDGIDWSEQFNPGALDLNDVAYGNSHFAACGNAVSDTYIATSMLGPP